MLLHCTSIPCKKRSSPKATRRSRASFKRLPGCARRLDAPVIVKEVGWGIDAGTTGSLLKAGVAAVDVAGAGGTSWSQVEAHRMSEPWRERAARAFAGWGIPTADCIREARAAHPQATLLASGGVRDGIDALKAIALGADAVGIAGPFLRAAAQGEDAAHELALELVAVLRAGMFAMGEADIASLSQTKRIHDVRTR